VVWQRLMDMRLRCAIVIQLGTQMRRRSSLTRQGNRRSECHKQRKAKFKFHIKQPFRYIYRTRRGYGWIHILVGIFTKTDPCSANRKGAMQGKVSLPLDAMSHQFPAPDAASARDELAISASRGSPSSTPSRRTRTDPPSPPAVYSAASHHHVLLWSRCE
jgi:hypothetical protein